jgi:phosphatidate cytidylyltransferase
VTASPHLSDDVHVPPSQSGAFRSRLIVAVGIILAFVGLATADATAFGGAAPAWWLVPAAVVLAQGAAAELIRLVAARGLDIRTWLVQIGTVVIVLSPLLSQTVDQPVDGSAADHAAGVGPLGWTAVACVAVWGGLLLTEVARYRRDNHGLERFVAGMAITCGLGLPLAFLVGLRLLGRDLAAADGRPAAGLTGMLPLVSLIAVVKAGDIAAYAVGSLLGRHRMAPLVSPGKTWEGAVASLAGSLLAAWLVFERIDWGTPARPWGGWIEFGLLIGLAGMAGDLSESLVKRELAAKDSGRTLGGLGGVLDLVDSLLLAAPLAWALWVA